MRDEYPGSISIKDIQTKYPATKGMFGSYPWFAWLSSCEWVKETRTLYLRTKDLEDIHLPKWEVNDLAGKKDKVFVVQSHVTDVWYPFILKKDLTSDTYFCFTPVDYECPIDYLLLER
jgi:hypothetical protein